MELLYGVVMVLAITFGVCIVAYIVTTKIGEEQRKNADYAIKCTEKIIKSMPRAMIDTFKEIMKIQEQETTKKYDSWKPTVYGNEEEPEANG